MARKSFSERVGAVKPRAVLQVGNMDAELRTRLWNALDAWVRADPLRGERFATEVWTEILVRTVSGLAGAWYERFQHQFFEVKWHVVYQIVEHAASLSTSLQANLAAALEKGGSGYRFVGDELIEITNETEIDEIERALEGARDIGETQTHLQQAITLYGDRTAPDYRNAIKEAISGVECLVNIINQARGKKGGETLGDALKTLGHLGQSIHPALNQAFNKLYGYTSDSRSGIRHYLSDPDTEPGATEARFMLVAVSAFVNYLIAKASDAGLALK